MMPIQEYPQTRPLAREDKTIVDRYLAANPPDVSEMTFTNLYAWRGAYRFEVARLDQALLILSRGPKEIRLFEPLVASGDRKRIMEECVRRSDDRQELFFIRIPESTAALFVDDSRWDLIEDRDNFDYVYRRQDLVELKGGDYDAKRNFIRRFKESYSFEFRLMKPADIDACLSFQQEWCLAKDCLRVEGLSREQEATEEMLKNFSYLGIRGAMIEIDGQVEAVTLGEPLNRKVFVIHIEKANGNFIGIYQTINQLFCRESASGFEFINREQDLGVLGLRKAKESYHPSDYVKKFILRPKR